MIKGNGFVMTAVLLSVISSPIFLGCSAAMKIQSEPPGADAFIRPHNGNEKKSLGKTPVEIPYSDLMQKIGGSPPAGEYLILTLESEAYETKEVLVPSNTFGNQSTFVQIKMEPTKDIVTASQILTRLHNAQKFAQNEQFERAHIETDKALEIDDQFVRTISLKGSIYYLQKNYSEALRWFEKSLTIDPSFDEAVKMITKIKRRQEQGRSQ